MSTVRITALAILLAVAAPAASEAQRETIRVVLFPLGTALPLYVAHELRYFEGYGLDVELSPTPNSPHLVAGLADGTYHVAMAVIDNFIAYQEGQHVAPYQPGRDLVVVMGGAPMNLSLVARPGIESIDDLRGTTLGVDTPVTGFAFVLYRMLEAAGVGRDQYEVVEAGATNLRWQRLRDGDVDATILAGGLTQQAEAAGFRILATSDDVLGRYQGTVLATNRQWAERNALDLTRFTMAVLDALDWLYVPENEARAAEILAEHLQMPLPAAQRTIAELKSPAGLTRDASILADGVDVVLELRTAYGRGNGELGSIDDYVDLRYLEQARRVRPMQW